MSIGQRGLVVDDRYRLEELIGVGGFGEVWRATQEVEGESVRAVALKLLAAPGTIAQGTPAPPPESHGWLNEVRAVRELRCEAISTIFDVGIAKQPRVAFIAMELLRGVTLHRRLADGPVYWRRALSIVRRVAAALSACHQVGVSHCDLKPQNVYLTESGRICVLDFGIAALGADCASDGVRTSARSSTGEPSATDETGVVSIDELPDGAPSSRRSHLVGTPGYIAPEVYGDEYPGPGADIYALGVVLYQMIAGRLPYRLAPEIADRPLESSSREEVSRFRAALSAATVCGDIVPLDEVAAGIPRGLARLVADLLALDPRDRPTDSITAAIDEVWVRPYGLPDPPYVGLESFDRTRTGYIAGRDADIHDIADKLRTRRAIVLSGPSGCGKSSLAVAGVTSRIDEELVAGLDGWRPVVIRPTIGSKILRCVAAEPTPDQRVGTVVVVDQLEEVLALSSEERLGFCDALATLAEGSGAVEVAGEVLGGDSPVKVVGTVRDDLFGRVAALPELRRFPEQNLYTVRGVEPNAVAAIVRDPAERIGYELEEADKVVAEATRVLSDDPSALPLVQFALTRWWEGRDEAGRRLRRREWDKIGGIEGALAEAAQTLYESLDGDDRERMRSILIELFRSDGTRVRVGEDEVATTPEALRLLERRRVRRLVRRQVDADNRATLEVVHEALARRWPLLRSWLEETRAERELLQYVEREAARWREDDKPAEMLWGGERLEAAVKLGDKVGDNRDFIAAGSEQSRRQRALKRGLIAATFAGLVVVVILLAWGYVRSENAREAAEVANAEREVALEQYFDQRALNDEQQAALNLRSDEASEARAIVDQLRAQAGKTLQESPEYAALKKGLDEAERKYKVAEAERRKLQQAVKNAPKAKYSLPQSTKKKRATRKSVPASKREAAPEPATDEAGEEAVEEQNADDDAPSDGYKGEGE